MTRYRILVEYDGGPFAGWQMQENAPTIQASLEEAGFKISGEHIRMDGAGRTDAGVHALGQVAHFDMEKDFSPDQLRDALNFHLRPLPISVLEAQIVEPDFHARFGARSRHYLYLICNRRARLAIHLNRVWLVNRPLDDIKMHEAAQILVGRHDFTSFRATLCQSASPIKTLDRLSVSRQGDNIHIEADARSFLHHQVRNIVGSLAMVGAGKWNKEDIVRILAAKDRAQAGPTAPPEGLYLTRVQY